MPTSSKFIENFFKSTFNTEKAVALLLLVLMLSAVYVGYIRDIELTNSWNGGTPVGTVWEGIDAPNRDSRDFVNASTSNKGHHAASLASWVYPFAYKQLGVDPEIAQKMYIFISIFIYAYVIHLLARKLLGDSWIISVSVVSIIIAIHTKAIDVNFARYGQANLDLGDIYSVAIPLVVLSLVLVISKRYVASGMCLSLLACVYIQLSVMATIISIFIALFCTNKKNVRDSIVGLILTIIVGILWSKYILGVFDNSYNKISLEEWLSWMKMMNYHFFPFSLHLFKSLHYQSLTPFLGILMLALSNPALDMMPADMRKMWLVGIIASLAITMLGLIISLYPPSISLAMLSLHRTSSITLLLALPIAAWHLVVLLRSDMFWGPGFAFACLLPPLLLQTWGIPLMPSLALAIIALVNNRERITKPHLLLLAVAAASSIAYLPYLYFAADVKLAVPEVLGNYYIIWLLIFIVLMYTATYYYRNSRTVYEKSILRSKISKGLIPLLVLALVAYAVHGNWKRHPKVPADVARSYYEAQKWALATTPPDAVFMPDPGYPAYGRAWSEYSRRASFGSAREWLHVPLVYHADSAGFAEGLRRLSLLGINPFSYREAAYQRVDKKVMAEYARLISDTRKAYYSLTAEHIIGLAAKEGIDYFVFDKKWAHPLPNLKRAYENKHFVIAQPFLIQ